MRLPRRAGVRVCPRNRPGGGAAFPPSSLRFLFRHYPLQLELKRVPFLVSSVFHR